MFADLDFSFVTQSRSGMSQEIEKTSLRTQRAHALGGPAPQLRSFPPTELGERWHSHTRNVGAMLREVNSIVRLGTTKYVQILVEDHVVLDPKREWEAR